MNYIAHKILFPAPSPPNYAADSFPDSLIWIPVEDEKESIPALWVPYPRSDVLVIFSHGNGCDIGSMYSTLTHYSYHWQVNILAWEYPGYGLCPVSTLVHKDQINIDMLKPTIHHDLGCIIWEEFQRFYVSHIQICLWRPGLAHPTYRNLWSVDRHRTGVWACLYVELPKYTFGRVYPTKRVTCIASRLEGAVEHR